MAAITTVDTIDINIFLQSPSTPGAQFGNLLILVNEADGTGNGLNGDRFRSYSSTADSASDQTAGYITTATKALIDLCFTQTPPPPEVLVGRVDTVGAETYVQALDACIAAGASFYAVVDDSLTAAIQVALSNDIEAKEGYIYGFSDDSADWLTSGLPAAYSTIESNEKTTFWYHDTNSGSGGRPDIAFLAAWLNIRNPDEQSAPTMLSIAGITAYGSALSASAKSNLMANGGNYVGRFSSAPTFTDPGQMMSLRPAYERLTADWLQARLTEDVEAQFLALATQGKKWPLDFRGQVLGKSVIQTRLAAAIAANHITNAANGGVDPTVEVASMNLSTRTITYTVTAMFAGSLRLFNANVYLYRS